jgi:hypothetical protein
MNFQLATGHGFAKGSEWARIKYFMYKIRYLLYRVCCYWYLGSSHLYMEVR